MVSSRVIASGAIAFWGLECGVIIVQATKANVTNMQGATARHRALSHKLAVETSCKGSKHNDSALILAMTECEMSKLSSSLEGIVLRARLNRRD